MLSIDSIANEAQIQCFSFSPDVDTVYIDEKGVPQNWWVGASKGKNFVASNDWTHISGLDALVFGGAGGSEALIKEAIASKVMLVLDGTWINHLASREKFRSKIISGYKSLVLTPNKVEMQCLYDAVFTKAKGTVVENTHDFSHRDLENAWDEKGVVV